MTCDLAVIIPHYKDYVRLDQCLEDLNACAGRDWTDIVVIHSGDTRPDHVFEHHHKGVRFLHEPKRGAGPARNLGVARSTAPYLLFIDADCRPAPDLLIEARRHADAADIVGGHIDLFDETPGHRTGAEAFEAVFAFRQKTYVRRKHFAATANLFTKRSVFDAVGPFTTDIAEDKEWCLRARSLGYTITYARRMRVRHPSRGTWESLVQKWRRLMREEFALMRRSSIFLFAWLGKFAAMPLSILLDLPRVWFSARLNGPSERILASWTLIKLRLWRMHKMLEVLRHDPPQAHHRSE